MLIDNFRHNIKREKGNLIMEDIIYLLCTRLKRKDGLYDYEPIITQNDGVSLIACTDLIDLQDNYHDIITDDGIDTMIVSVPLKHYMQLENSISCKLPEKVQEAADKIQEVYNTVGLSISRDDAIQKCIPNENVFNHVGKVLDPRLLPKDRDDSIYVSEDTMDTEDGLCYYGEDD